MLGMLGRAADQSGGQERSCTQYFLPGLRGRCVHVPRGREKDVTGKQVHVGG